MSVPKRLQIPKNLVFGNYATALGHFFFKKSNWLSWGDVISPQSIDSNLLRSVEKTKGWKETKSGFVPTLKTCEAGLQVI